jgi:putative redox protein
MQTARIRWVDGEVFLGTSVSGHAVPFDSDRERNTAPGPMEMLLLALGSCTGTDVVSILKKKRQQMDGFEIEVSGTRAEEPPRVWTEIKIFYRVWGRVDEKALRDAIALSESKYCSVSAMLGKTAVISTRFEILPG